MKVSGKTEVREFVIEIRSRLNNNLEAGEWNAVKTDANMMKAMLGIFTGYKCVNKEEAKKIEDLLDAISGTATPNSIKSAKWFFLELNKILTEKFDLN